MENTSKKVLLILAYLGGYPGLSRGQEYTFFGKLYAKGYTNVREGEEDCLWASKHPLPELPSSDISEVNAFLAEQGYEVLPVELVEPELVPEPNKIQQSYKTQQG